MLDPGNPPVKRARKSAAVSEFVVKENHDDGSVTWSNPETLDEIRLNQGTAPTRELLAALAANGIVPKPPTLEDYEERQETALQGDLHEPLEIEDDNPLSRVLTRIKSIGGGESRAEVRVYKVRADTREAFCGKFTIDQWDEFGEELLRAHYGPGDYRVRVYGPSLQEGGSNYGKFVRLTNTLVIIEPSLIPLKSTIPNAPDSSNAAMAFMPLIESLRSEIAALRQTGPAADPMEQMQKMAQLMRTLGMTGGKSESKSVLEQIKEMEAMLGMREKLSEARDGGGSGGGDSLVSMATQLLGTIQSHAQQPQPPQIVGPVPSVDIPASFATHTPNPQPSQPLENETVNPVQQSFLLLTVGALLRAAKRNDSIELHAPGLADKLPEEICDALETPLWWDFLVTAVPPPVATECEAYKPWFTQLRDRIVALLYEDDEPGPNPAPGSGPAL